MLSTAGAQAISIQPGGGRVKAAKLHDVLPNVPWDDETHQRLVIRLWLGIKRPWV